MEIKNFKVVNQEVSETQQGVVNNNTVVLNFSHRKDENPHYVGFSIIRGKESDPKFTGQPFVSGSVNSSGDLQTQTHGDKQRSDRALLFEVWEICDRLINPLENDVDTGK
ncbi:MAG: hypothetical protein KGV59_07635 [Tenacibaculum sp.]|nr:hypothetical protein [Tenacibaculum sp.]